jgi:hypothetical protein
VRNSTDLFIALGFQYLIYKLAAKRRLVEDATYSHNNNKPFNMISSHTQSFKKVQISDYHISAPPSEFQDDEELHSQASNNN